VDRPVLAIGAGLGHRSGPEQGPGLPHVGQAGFVPTHAGQQGRPQNLADAGQGLDPGGLGQLLERVVDLVVPPPQFGIEHSKAPGQEVDPGRLGLLEVRGHVKSRSGQGLDHLGDPSGRGIAVGLQGGKQLGQPRDTRRDLAFGHHVVLDAAHLKLQGLVPPIDPDIPHEKTSFPSVEPPRRTERPGTPHRGPRGAASGGPGPVPGEFGRYVVDNTIHRKKKYPKERTCGYYYFYADKEEHKL